ncbi:alpha/beta-hydrolase [Zopfia rhizophila CBS 207.26]|uniref:Alpha/beta-hydrolase n=1 Tax=Zopfia rhizophila CBS 207.26 TaxID=1314779 RepID=A0A6A6DR36_9PEZI|nr:alpha/beta-hydrolase [Zopfia rhizophila CBS 207.26]
MPFRDIKFRTSDGVTLRGWFFTPESFIGKLPCLVMAPGYAAIIKMGISASAEYFTSKLRMSCLMYDNRGFGSSDVREGAPKREIIPHLQISDYSDAITYAQSLPEVDPNRIGVPFTSGWENFNRTYRPEQIAALSKAFQEDRLDRAAEKEPRRIAVVDEKPGSLVAMPQEDSYAGYQSFWSMGLENDITLKSVEALRSYEPGAAIHRISPTPLLMSIMDNDGVTPHDVALEAFNRAREPKQLKILHGGHFDPYIGESFESNIATQTKFLEKWLL